MNETEKRAIPCEVRAEPAEDGKSIAKITGYGAVFNKRSELISNWFREVIAPGAFDDVLKDDVRALFNHDPNFVLGRTVAGTLSLSVDAQGLRYEIAPPDTQTVRDLVLEPLKRGDITGSSFAFRVADDSWGEDPDGTIVRTINKFSRLLDISPVTYPAYPDAGASARSLEERWKEARGTGQRAINERLHRERYLDTL